MKKLIAYLLLASIALLMIGMCSCKVKREVEELSEMQRKTDINLDTKSHTEIKTTIDTTSLISHKTTTTETTYDVFVDPKTGELKSLPVSEKKTEVEDKSEQKGESGKAITNDQQDKSNIKEEENDKTKKKSKFKIDPTSLTTVLIIALIALFARYYQSIFSWIKWIIK